MAATTHPTASSGLDLNEAEDGLVVYDETTDMVHHLNCTAAMILMLCDGTRDGAAIAEFLAGAFGLDEPPRAETEECLTRLAEQGLVR